MTIKSLLLSISALTLSGIGTLQASIINGGSNGLSGQGITPSYSLTFDNTPGLSANSPITNQYSSAGVSFSGPAYYDGNNDPAFGGCNFSHISGDCVTNYTTGGGTFSGQYSPFSPLFCHTSNGRVFCLGHRRERKQQHDDSALRNGVVVDQFTATTNLSTTNDFYGFYNESTPFDQIQIALANTPGNTVAQLQILDNLQIQSIPEPSTTGMLLAGLGSLVIGTRRWRRSA